MIKISLDLDDTLFDMTPVYRMAFDEHGIPYRCATSWDLHESYDKKIAERMYELFKSDHIYKTKLLDKNIPAAICKVYNSGLYSVKYVTQRSLKNPQKTFAQIRDAGLPVKFEDVYDLPGEKIDVLKSIGSKLHFDDSPNVIDACLRSGIRCIMISNDQTPYNHHLRGKVAWFTDIISALQVCLTR